MPSEVPGLSTSWCVRVTPASPRLDGHGRDVLLELRQIGFEHIEAIASSRLYFLVGNLDERHVQRLACELLSDPVAETYTVTRGLCERVDNHPAIEVHRLPGVTDPAAMSTLGAVQRLLKTDPDGDVHIDQVQTGRRYQVIGAQTRDDLERIAARVLANDCVETWYLDGFDRSDPIPAAFSKPPQRPFSLRQVSIRDLQDGELASLSRDGHLFLSLPEMRTIRDYYLDADRDPTDLELETLAQTWSEHCVHKTLKSAIDYEGDGF